MDAAGRYASHSRSGGIHWGNTLVLAEKAIRVSSSRSPVRVMQAAQHRRGPHWPCRTRLLQRIQDLLLYSLMRSVPVEVGRVLA